MNTQEPIKFWKTSQPYGEFSNFYKSRIIMARKSYETVEHYFQSQKFLDEELQEKIRLIPKPHDAAIFARDRSLPLRKDWEEVKEEIMENALIVKFATYSNLEKLLLNTGTREIIEDSPVDYYWGCGKDGSGKNRLGILLMKVREEFSNGLIISI